MRRIKVRLGVLSHAWSFQEFLWLHSIQKYNIRVHEEGRAPVIIRTVTRRDVTQKLGIEGADINTICCNKCSGRGVNYIALQKKLVGRYHNHYQDGWYCFTCIHTKVGTGDLR